MIIVDDEPLARAGLLEYLREDVDIEVIAEASNGRDAISLIERNRPDLVFLDIQMPVTDGLGVVKRLSEKRPLPHVVFVTAFDEHAVRAFEINAVDYLLKPVTRARFRKTLERVRARIGQERRGELDEKMSALLDALGPTPISKPEFLRRITVKNAGRIYFLEVSEIDRISSEGNYA